MALKDWWERIQKDGSIKDTQEQVKRGWEGLKRSWRGIKDAWKQTNKKVGGETKEERLEILLYIVIALILLDIFVD